MSCDISLEVWSIIGSLRYHVEHVNVLHMYIVVTCCIVLVIGLENKRYTGSESSGFVEVVVIISGGSSTTPISVMVAFNERSAAG